MCTKNGGRLTSKTGGRWEVEAPANPLPYSIAIGPAFNMMYVNCVYAFVHIHRTTTHTVTISILAGRSYTYTISMSRVYKFTFQVS